MNDQNKNNRISALAIVFNEEHNIRQYLDNMSFADEIIVVDSFSTDNTPSIIKNEYPHVKFYQRVFDDFSSQRNYTLDLASNDWVTFFDADERVTQKGIEEIINTVNSNPEEDAFWVKRIFYYEGKPFVTNNFNDDKTSRIFRRSRCRYSSRLVHEKLDIKGKSKVLKHAIHHYSFKDKEDFLQKRLQYSRLKAKEFYNDGVKTNIFHFTIKPAFRFFKFYILMFGFVNGRRGYEMAKILGYHVYMRYVYLKEMNERLFDGKKILVIQEKMIGDVLAGSIMCSALKQTYPTAQIDYLVYDFTRPVIENNPNIDNIIIFKEDYRKSKLTFFKFLLKVRRTKYAAVIDAYNKWESGIITLFSGAGKRIGYKKWYTSFFYDHTIELDWKAKDSALTHRLQLIETLTGLHYEPEFPKIFLTECEVAHARQLLAASVNPELPVIMISAMGSDDIKSLPAQVMAQMLDVVAANTNAQLLFNYLPKQQHQAKEIYDLCAPATKEKILFEFYTKSLREFIAVLSECDALIGNEGGAVNMAKALDVPTFTIFSPWINKSSWNMLADGEKHLSVHLQDFHPEIYGDRHPKELKDQSKELYKKLTLDLFKDKLIRFVKKISK